MKKIGICNLIIGLLLSVSLVVHYYVSDARRKLLPPNAIVGGVDIGGLTVEEANDKITGAYSDYTVSIYDRFTNTEIVFGENIGLWLDFEAAVNEIFAQKSASWVSDLWKKYVSDAEGVLRFDNDMLLRFVYEHVSAWNASTEQQEDAYIVLGDDSFEIVNEEPGTLLEYVLVYNILLPAIYDGIPIVDLSICRTPFYGTTADDLTDALSYLNTYADFRLEYETGEFLDFKYLVENEWLIFSAREVRLAEYKAIEYVMGFGNAYDTDDLVLDAASESVQLIADIYSNAHISRNMIFKEKEQSHDLVQHLIANEGCGQIDLSEFLDDFGIGLSEYLDIIDTLEDWRYPHYLSGNAFRYADYWSHNPDMPASTVFALVNVKADIEPYSFVTEVYQPNSIWLLVNKNYKLPHDMVAEDLVRITYGYRLREETAEHFTMMADAMVDEGLNLRVVSTYRSYYTQERLHRNDRNSYGLAYADLGTARAGHSEHQTGLTVDVGQINVRFKDTPEFTWLYDNAYKYGFILRYPDGYTDIHGYKYEPWHWRYVGVGIATAMRDKDIVLYEEFYGKYLAPEVLYMVKQLILEQREHVDVIDFKQYIMEKAGQDEERAVG